MTINVDTSLFSLKIEDFVAKAKGKELQFATEFIQDLGEAVIEATPVVTGFLRGSWYADLNNIGGSVGVNDASGAQSIANIGLTAADMKIGDTLYLLNGAVYARRVEYGFVGKDSLGREYHQAPRAFVRGTVDRAGAIADAAAIRVGNS